MSKQHGFTIGVHAHELGMYNEAGGTGWACRCGLKFTRTYPDAVQANRYLAGAGYDLAQRAYAEHCEGVRGYSAGA